MRLKNWTRLRLVSVWAADEPILQPEVGGHTVVCRWIHAGRHAASYKYGSDYITELDLYVTDRIKELSKDWQHPVTSKPVGLRPFPLSKMKS